MLGDKAGPLSRMRTSSIGSSSRWNPARRRRCMEVVPGSSFQGCMELRVEATELRDSTMMQAGRNGTRL